MYFIVLWKSHVIQGARHRKGGERHSFHSNGNLTGFGPSDQLPNEDLWIRIVYESPVGLDSRLPSIAKDSPHAGEEILTIVHGSRNEEIGRIASARFE